MGIETSLLFIFEHNLNAMKSVGMIDQIDVKGISQILNTAIKKRAKCEIKQEEQDVLFDDMGRVL